MVSATQRRSFFRSLSRQPFSDDPNIQPKDGHTSGPFSFFNPTRSTFNIPIETGAPGASLAPGLSKNYGTTSSAADLPPGLEYRWRARDNRKGRHALVVDPAAVQSLGDKVTLPPSTSTWDATFRGIGRMFTEFPIWDVSYLVAQFFTWGSVIFIINGLFYLLPLAYPSLPDDGAIGGGVTSFIGCLFYQVGVILLMFEAVNENRTGCFGWALEKAFSHRDDDDDGGGDGAAKLVPAKEHCRHHHQNKYNIVGKGRRAGAASDAAGPSAGSIPLTASGANLAPSDRTWVWLPTWDEFAHHYLFEIGFLASFLLFLSATVFWMVGFASLPGIADKLSPGAEYGVFWTPDVLGSIGFVVSSGMLVVETQPNWYTPAPHLIGWHANMWNLIGSVGFLLSAVFGVCSEAGRTAGTRSMCLFQSDIHTTWGSAAFLIGSVILWYESLDKHPVEYTSHRS